MRHHIDHKSSSTMAWDKLSPGIYCKMLNHNEETGDRTGLFLFDPSEGAAPPSVCHYHSVYEELFILDGRMTFDHKTWLGAHGYVFHPPFAVHGFKSAVPERTLFLARAPADLDFNYPDAPDATETFFIDGKTASRDVTYLNPPEEDTWGPVLIPERPDGKKGPEASSIGRRLVLNEDRETGEGSSLIRFHAGYTSAAHPAGHNFAYEGFVLSGRVTAEDGTTWQAGDYWHRRPGAPVPALTIEESTLIFSSVGPA